MGAKKTGTALLLVGLLGAGITDAAESYFTAHQRAAAADSKAKVMACQNSPETHPLSRGTDKKTGAITLKCSGVSIVSAPAGGSTQGAPDFDATIRQLESYGQRPLHDRLAHDGIGFFVADGVLIVGALIADQLKRGLFEGAYE